MNLIEVEIILIFMFLDVAAMARLQKVESMTKVSSGFLRKKGAIQRWLVEIFGLNYHLKKEIGEAIGFNYSIIVRCCHLR
jgi:hypothetical protein